MLILFSLGTALAVAAANTANSTIKAAATFLRSLHVQVRMHLHP